METIRRILYPTDFSEYSLVALPLAVDLTKHYGAELDCLHVVDVEQEFFREGGYIAPLMVEHLPDRDQMVKAAQTHLDAFVAEHMPELKAAVRQVVVSGKPFAEIIRHARERDIDLIVLGTHGHSALRSMLLGTVAEKVVRKAPCAVLTVRHPEHRFEAP